MKRVAVVGGGISGLACAYVLAKNGVDVKLYEMNNVLGGGIKEYPVGDTSVALGAKTISMRYTNFISLIREMGLADRIAKQDHRIGIFTRHRLIEVAPIAILFNESISMRTKFDLLRFKRFLNGFNTDSKDENLIHSSLKDFVIQNYSSGVLDDFIEPFVRAFFADTAGNLSAMSGLQVISGAFETYELKGGYYPLVSEMESRLGERVVKGLRMEKVSTRSDGRFLLKSGDRSDEADIVVCCVPVPELQKIVEGISYPEVRYVSKMAYAIEGESRYPHVGEIINGDPELHVDVVHFTGNLACLSSVREDPDLSTFFRSPKVLAVHRWPYCSPRTKPGSPTPRFETEIPNLYKSGDMIYGGGLEAASRAGIEVAELLIHVMAAGRPSSRL